MRKTLQKYRESLLLLVIMLLLCVFFSGPGKKYTNWEIQKDYLERNAPESFLLTVNGVELTIPTNQPGLTVDAGWLTTEHETKFCIGDFSAMSLWINGISVNPGSQIALQLDSLNSNAPIVLHIKDERTDWERDVFIRTLPLIISDISRVAPCTYEASERYYYFSLDNFLVKMNPNGETVYYRYGKHAKGFHPSPDSAPEKKYGYLEAYSVQNEEQFKAVVLNENYGVTEIFETMNSLEGAPVSIRGFQILGDGSYLVWGTYERLTADFGQDTLERRVQETVIQIWQEGQVIWEWDSAKHIEQFSVGTSINKGELWYDYLGCIEIADEGDSLYCLFTEQNMICKILRSSGQMVAKIEGDQLPGKICSISAQNGDLTALLQAEDGMYTLYKLDMEKQNGDSILEHIQRAEMVSGPIFLHEDKGHYLIAWGENSQGILFSDIQKAPITLVAEFYNSNIKNS